MIKKASKNRMKKVCQLLRHKEVRDSDGLFAVGGQKIIRDIFRKEYSFTFAVAADEFLRDRSNKEFFLSLSQKGIDIYRIDDKSFGKASSLRNSQGILAVGKKLSQPELVLAQKENTVFILCDGIQDPGNFGTIIRTSLAFGARAVLTSGESVDIYNSKVIRASSGAIFDIPVYPCDAEKLEQFKLKGCRILAARVKNEKTKEISKIGKNDKPLILIFGNEGKGISTEIENAADDFFYIPIDEKVESLNVAAAVAVSLYQLTK